MSAWTIFDYVEGEVDQIRVWIDSLPKKAQAKIDMRIGYLQITQTWPPQYMSARRDCPGIYELRISCTGVQYRPLGYFGPRQREFTLLMGAIEKGGCLEPRAFCVIATRLREIVNGDRSRIIPHRFG